MIGHFKMALPIRKAIGIVTQSIVRGNGRVPPVLVQHHRCLCDPAESRVGTFDEKMLEFLVCPLTKQPLRYDQDNNELISDTMGVAYPIINGIPNLVPQDGRMLDKKADNPT